MSQNIIVFDVETTGLDEEKSPITQIALLSLNEETLVENNRFETHIQPYADLKLDEKVLNKTSVKLVDVLNGMEATEFCDVAIKILETNKTGKGRLPILCGFNVNFDIKFLKYLFDYCGEDLFQYVDYLSTIDVLRYARWYWKQTEENHKLKTCCQRLGIELVDAHGAMADVIATTELLKFFITQFSESGMVSTDLKINNVKKTRQFYRF